MQENKLKNINKIIDAEAYSGGILDRAQEAATKDDEIVKNVIIASRHKRKSHKSQRK